MKRESIKDIYRSVRKPVPKPTKVERDRRGEIEEKEADREIDREPRKRGGPGERTR